MRKKLFRLLTIATILCLVMFVVIIFLLQGSLPIQSGEMTLKGLRSPVIVSRDQLGIPSIQGDSRIDIARATGFLHAQERFFQMDLMRRAAAGELAELFGSELIDFDKERRLHLFRSTAQEIFTKLTIQEQSILSAYTEGVNEGLAHLQIRPFEYLLLLEKPSPWLPEDCLLVCLGLYFELQDFKGEGELTRKYMQTLLPAAVYQFFIKNGSTWEAALDGSHLPILPIPSAEEFSYLKETPFLPHFFSNKHIHLGGSNCWAITGKRTQNEKAILACDMHLNFATPNIWYRAAFLYNDLAKQPVAVYGVTLPGTPLMIIGSNTNIAWGFTNAYAHTTDLIPFSQEQPNKYLTAEGALSFETNTQRIQVKRHPTINHNIKKTIWGPVIHKDFFGKSLALKWVAHDKDAINVRLIDLETAYTAADALKLCDSIQIPILNFIVADKEGSIGWRFVGKSAENTQHQPQSYLNPSEEILWTANNRVLQETYPQEPLNGIRAFLIRRKLLHAENATPLDLLKIQLDTDALFFKRWQELMLSILEKADFSPKRQALKEALLSWDGKSDIDSIGYYWIRTFRNHAYKELLARFLAPCFKVNREFAHEMIDFEEPVWLLASQQPDYLIHPRFTSWHAELLSYLDNIIQDYDPEQIKHERWGSHTHLKMQHPLSMALPFLEKFLDMKPEEMAGDYYSIRLCSPSEGASQRMIVSPGLEKEGIFHSPGGQSGHPLSPHYRDSHSSWVKGEATPFLPGKPQQVLTLYPGTV